MHGYIARLIVRRRFNYRNNLEASVSLLNEAVKQDTKVFVFTSSIAAFGVAEVK
jgi:nucleoside-diphosphate-sugar epimerase